MRRVLSAACRLILWLELDHRLWRYGPIVDMAYNGRLHPRRCDCSPMCVDKQAR